MLEKFFSALLPLFNRSSPKYSLPDNSIRSAEHPSFDPRFRMVSILISARTGWHYPPTQAMLVFALRR